MERSWISDLTVPHKNIPVRKAPGSRHSAPHQPGCHCGSVKYLHRSLPGQAQAVSPSIPGSTFLRSHSALLSEWKSPVPPGFLLFSQRGAPADGAKSPHALTSYKMEPSSPQNTLWWRSGSSWNPHGRSCSDPRSPRHGSCPSCAFPTPVVRPCTHHQKKIPSYCGILHGSDFPWCLQIHSPGTHCLTKSWSAALWSLTAPRKEYSGRRIHHRSQNEGNDFLLSPMGTP